MFTRLELLNHLLSTVGEDPVTNYNSQHPSAITARNTLEGVNKEFQSKGWWFNSDYRLPLTPNTNQEVILPSDTLSVRPYAPYSYLVRRKGKLYNPITHTYKLGTTVYADIITKLPIEDLPDVAAIYLKHWAAHTFFTNDDGDMDKAQDLYTRVLISKASFDNEHLKMSRVNSKNRPVVASVLSGIQQIGQSFDPRYPGGRP